MTFWNFWHEHYFLAFCAIYFGFETSLRIVSRTLRTINIAIRGWPPAHLDADGDWKKDE